MNFTLIQLEQIVRKVMKDETKDFAANLATRSHVEGLIVKVDGLAKKIDFYLDK